MNDTKRTPIGTAFLALLALSLIPGTGAKGASVADGSDTTEKAPRAQTVKMTAAAVKGRVFEGSKPIEAVKVYAYEVASFAIRKVLSDDSGHFSFKSLPAGMYQIVAHKDGFAPSVELLLRKSPDTHQFVEIRMQEEAPDDMRQAEDYWSVRSRVPADVLRDINSSAHDLDAAFAPGLLLSDDSQFTGQMLANSGLEQLGGSHGDAQLTTAQVDLLGAVGEVKVSLNGTFQQLAQRPDVGSAIMPDGEARSMALRVEGTDNSNLSVTTANGQLASLRGEEVLPVDLETYQLRWSGQAGDKGRTEISAQYMEETNFHQVGWLDPANISGASQYWNLEGLFDGELSEKTSLRAGVSYRQRSREISEDPFEVDFGNKSFLDPSVLPGFSVDEDQAIDAYGIAGSKIQPRILVEYGLYSSVRDGSLSLMPHGGMVVELGNAWRAETGLSHRIEQDSDTPTTYGGFETAFFGDDSSCQRSGESCYEVKFAKKGTVGDSFSIGAVHRKFAETLRLYFSPDFFHRLESVFVVEGDSVPEVQFSLVRRIAPRVLAKLESNFASGGGGIFYATDDLAYENEVRYLVTSLDTRFQSTATGVFVAFHHLEQALNPVIDERRPAAEVEMQRLQVMLTQDLSALADFAANWAVRFNVELSRGSSPYTLTEDDELRKKLTGGISVSF